MAEQIETAEELDALPVGSVVLDRDGDAWQRSAREDEARWDCTVRALNATEQPSSSLALILGPLTVLCRPDAPAPSDEAPEDFAAAVESMRGEMSAGAYLYLRDRLAARSSQPTPSVSAEQVEEAVELTEWDEQRPALPALAFLEALGIEVTP